MAAVGAAEWPVAAAGLCLTRIFRDAVEGAIVCLRILLKAEILLMPAIKNGIAMSGQLCSLRTLRVCDDLDGLWLHGGIGVVRAMAP